MPRANRYFLPGHVWHITHRCHKKESLLKFVRDRTNWIHWLFEARRRYGLEILNYTVTTNHIHLLVHGTASRKIIPRSLQLVAGRTAQAYNQRKSRKGAFWEDRYHATAVDTDEHLLRCLVYIDLNMVRAGVVQHPLDWPHGGYHEIINPPRRYCILARKRLKQLLGIDEETLVNGYPKWVADTIQSGSKREGMWTGAVAVGGEPFVDAVKKTLGNSARHRSIQADGQTSVHATHTLKEEATAYSTDFGGEIGTLSPENRLVWNVFPEN